MNLLKILILVTLTQLSFGSFVHKDGPYIIGNRVTPDASAMFQVETTTKGYLVPRLTTIQRDAIASPAEGLQLYNTDTKSLQVYTGGAWAAIGGGGSDHPGWTVATGYDIGAIVVDLLTFKVYRANFAHVSDAILFATDLALGYWDELSDDLDRLTISVDETLPRFDGTTGGLIQSSGVTISDTDGVGNVTNLAIGSASTLTSSIFDTTSTTQGTRPCPLMTEVQRDAIVAPANGLCIFNTATDKLNIYSSTATAWVSAGGGLDKWETAKDYKIDDVIWESVSNKIYRATADHTSGVFLTDIANWTELSPATFETTFFDSANEINGPVLHMSNLQEIYSHTSSAGLYEGGALTDNADGTISIAESSVAIRVLPDSHENMVHATVAASGVIILTDAAANYVYIDYNSGSPQWAVSTSATTTNGLDKILGYLVSRRGNLLKVVDARETALDFANKADQLFKDFGGFIHKDGGSLLGATGLNVTVTAGKFYYGVNPIPHDAFDTSIAGTAPANVFVSIYGSFVITDDVKLLDNVQYDNAGTLTNLGTGKWKVDWLYMVNDSPSTLALIYGDAQYNNQAQAELASAPAGLPPALSGVGVLIGRYLIQEGSSTVVAESSFERTFASASVTNHNDLSTLQGGTTDEYYHMTVVEHTIATQAATNLLDGYVTILAQSFAGIKTFVNGLLVDAGLVATPSIANSADTNTGIYFPVADSLGITTGGVEKLLVNDHVSITDDDGNFKVRKESRIRNIDQFKSVTPSSIYTEVGLTNAVTNETTTPIDGAQSAKFTVTTGDGTGTITRDAATSLLPKDYQLLGIHFDWLYDGNNGDVSLKIEESTDGITYTDLAEISLPKSTEATLAKLNFKLSSTSVTHYRYLFYINVAVNGAIAEWDNVKVITDPLPTAESVESVNYKISEPNNTLDNTTGDIQFSAALTGTITSNGDYEKFFTVDHSADPTTVTFLQRSKVTMNFHGMSSSALHAAGIFKNGSSTAYEIGTQGSANNANGQTQVTSSFIAEAGDYYTFSHVDPYGTTKGNQYSADTQPVIMSVTATASSSNVVFEGHATDTEWIDFPSTPTVDGGGTLTGVIAKYKRNGSTMDAYVTFTTGSVGTSIAALNIPFNIDTAVITTDGEFGAGLGHALTGASSALPNRYYFGYLKNSAPSKIYLTTTSVANVYEDRAANGIFSSSTKYTFHFKDIPIEGWKVTDPLLSVPVTNEVENTYSARIANDGTATIASQSAPFIASVNRASAGIITYIFVEGFFSEIPAIGAFISEPDGTGTDRRVPAYNVTLTGFTTRSTNHNDSAGDNDLAIFAQRQGADYKHPKGYFLGNLVPTQHVTGGTEYTTSEAWNGKPVYARSYNVTGSIVANFNIDTIDTGLNILDMKASAQSAAGNWLHSPSSGNFQVYYIQSTGVFFFNRVGDTWTDINATIYYTK